MWPEAAEIQQQSVILQVLKWPHLLLCLFNQWSQFPPAYWYFQLLFRQPSGWAPSQVCLTCLVMRGLSEMPWSHSWPQDTAFQSSKYFLEDLVHNTVFNKPVLPLTILPLAVWEKKNKNWVLTCLCNASVASAEASQSRLWWSRMSEMQWELSLE